MIYVLYFAVGYLILVSIYIYTFKKTKYGFFVTMGEFGAGKTQNMTAYLKYSNKSKEINISNYYTGYTDFQLSSHLDLINILNDIYDYHQYINLYDNIEKIYSNKQDLLPEYYEKANHFRSQYPKLKKGIKFNIVLDEASIYFNPRNFKKNFSGENERLLDFVYQPRKLNLLMFVVVQSPMELDVKFRRLATYYRKYYKGLGFYRWYNDYYFLNPEEIDLEKADKVGGGIFSGMNINFYNNAPILRHISFPNYDYDTKELIRPGLNIYKKHSIFDHMNLMNTYKKQGIIHKLYNKLKIK